MNNSTSWHFAFPERAPLVLIVLLNWNSAVETATAVASAREMDYPNFRILIVDNGSEQESLAQLRPLVKDRVELLESPRNNGFTGGCNLGIKRALELDAKYIWLLNNDAVVERHTLSSIVALAEKDPAIGLVTPQIAVLGEDRLTFAGGVISVKDGIYNETHDPAVAEEWNAKYPDCGLVIGTAMLVRAELARRIGGLDERFFAYFEDIDYSVRSREAGFRNLVDPNSVVCHLEKNRNLRPFEIKPHYWYYLARNESRFWRKHRGRGGSLRLCWYSFNGFLRHYNRLAGKLESRKAILAGLWDGWLDRGGAFRADARMPSLPAALVRIYSRRSALQPRIDPAANSAWQATDS
ncbi:MAG TPA: glycosyltransferase family 2 protein [Edaphobacter sp.]|nr:glycosyltransferase family 2 protein [Edaphobacter sp.]